MRLSKKITFAKEYRMVMPEQVIYVRLALSSGETHWSALSSEQQFKGSDDSEVPHSSLSLTHTIPQLIAMQPLSPNEDTTQRNNVALIRPKKLQM